MSWIDCIERALTEKKIKGKKADEARKQYKALYDEALADGMDDVSAQNFAADQATRRIEVEKAEQRKRQFAYLRKSIDTWKTMKAGGVDKLSKNIKSLVEPVQGATPGTISYGTYVDANKRYAHRLLAGLLEKHGSKYQTFVQRNAAGLERVVDEVFGETTGDADAASFAKGWIDATDTLRRRFNHAGGTLMELEDWRIFQKHSRVKLSKAGENDRGVPTWAADHMNWVDWNRSRWPDGSRVGVADRERFLTEAFKTHKTGGANKLRPGKAAGRTPLGNQFDAHRLIHYKDAASWKAAFAKYGEGNIFDAMMEHIDLVSHKTAMIQAFSPNPQMFKAQVGVFARAIAAEADIKAKTPRALDTVQSTLNTLDDTFDVISRATHAPANSSAGMFAAGMVATRNVTLAGILGSTTLISVPGDFMTSAMTLRFNRLPISRTMRDYFTLLRPGNAGDRMIAMQSGLINESASRIAYSHARFTGLEVTGPAFSRRLSDTVLRSSGLNHHTVSSRWANSMSYFANLGRERDVAFDNLTLAPLFQRYGITEADWNAMQTTPLYEWHGAPWLRPDDYIASSGKPEKEAMALADKFMAMIIDESKMGTLDATVRASVTLRGAARAGTPGGELLNSVAFLKNFPLTFFNWHVGRGMAQPTWGGKLAYVTTLFIGMTMAGAVSLQLRELMQGRDPLDMTTPQFWLRAMTSGGGAGIWGDFFIGHLTAYDKDIMETLIGAPAGFASDVWSLTGGNVGELIAGKDTHFTREAVRFLQRYFPGTTLWYARAALQHMVWDQLLLMTDPEAEQLLRQEVARRRRTTGQEYYWTPGEMTPSRMPDFSAALPFLRE